VDPQRGRADQAGEQMHSEIDAIQERLRALKRELDARESVVELEDEAVTVGRVDDASSLGHRSVLGA